jgi:membrane associated rhomboid family serine protease
MARSRTKTLGEAAEVSAMLVGVMIAAGVVELFVPPLRGLGIWPRSLWGLVGIVFSPLLHASLAHLTANTLPLFVLLTLLFWDKHYFPVRTLVLVWIASGVGTWLIGRGGAVHIGASSIIYGLVTYLIIAGILLQSWRSAAVALLVVLAYGGIIYGALPQAGPISWEGHFSGACAGIWAARNNHA